MRIIHDNGQGGVVITVPAPQYLKALMEKNPGIAEAQCMDFIAQKDCPKGCNYEIVEDSDVPTDRTFRDAWEHDTTAAPEKVRCNMAKAKLIAHEMRRAKRDEDMKPHDLMVNIPAKAKAAEASRQIIRVDDAKLQKNIDAAKDESVLKAVINVLP